MPTPAATPDGRTADRLADKRVGIIGTGATAVQCVPHLGAGRASCSCSSARRRRWTCATTVPPTPTGFAELKPGWQRERMDNFTTVISGGRFEEDLVNDGWTDLITNILLAARRQPANGAAVENTDELVQLADFQKMERVRARVDAVVKDRATAEALKPWYNQFCKRPCFHDQYLPTFNRPNVHLIDTQGKGVERITATGRGGGRQGIPLDCLIFGTGFEVGTDFTRRAGLRGARPQRPDADRQVEGRRRPPSTVCSAAASPTAS
jgi:cyclohexanone monooxygenase